MAAISPTSNANHQQIYNVAAGNKAETKYLIILSFILSFGCKAEKPPNIVVIMADDIGLGDVSHHVRTFMNREPIF